jgi:hypothetical protein
VSTQPFKFSGSGQVQAGKDKVLILPAIEFSPDATLDLTDNAMVIDYGGASPIDSIQSSLVSGYASGAWNGAGINSSSAAANAGTALGLAESSAINSVFPASFAGVQVDDTAVLIRYTITGDGNLDGSVDLTDFTYLAANFNAAGVRWWQGDYDYNNSVDLTDFTMLAANFNSSSGAQALAASQAPARTAPLFSATPLATDTSDNQRPVEGLVADVL